MDQSSTGLEKLVARRTGGVQPLVLAATLREAVREDAGSCSTVEIPARGFLGEKGIT